MNRTEEYFDLLNEQWSKEFGTDDKVVFWGFEELRRKDGFGMGRCYYFAHAQWTLDYSCQTCPTIVAESVAWHEFCHGYGCVNNKFRDHGWEFQKFKWKKPKYAFVDCMLKLIGWIWFD